MKAGSCLLEIESAPTRRAGKGGAVGDKPNLYGASYWSIG